MSRGADHNALASLCSYLSVFYFLFVCVGKNVINAAYQGVRLRG